MRMTTREVSLASVALLLSLATMPALGQTTGPAAAGVSADAKAVLSRFAEASHKLGAYRAAGKITTDVAASGRANHYEQAFATVFASPLLFRHEIVREVTVGSTGEKVFAYRPDLRAYKQDKASASGAYARADEVPAFAAEILDAQDPVLLAELTETPGEVLVRAATSVTSDAGRLTATYQSGETRTIEFDGTTGLPRKITIDFAEALRKRGVPDVKAGQAVIEYARFVPEEPAAKETFAWSPPEGAADAAKADQAGDGQEASALSGKPAPAFKLKDLDGKDVALSDLKGSVVLIDFWATWCPPCRAGLPFIDKLNTEFSARGVKVYGVNEQESAEDVKAFREKMKLSLPMILDSDGKAGNAYGVSGIPTTIVIGKDGVIRKVVVGFDPSEIDALRKEISAALEKP